MSWVGLQAAQTYVKITGSCEEVRAYTARAQVEQRLSAADSCRLPDSGSKDRQMGGMISYRTFEVGQRILPLQNLLARSRLPLKSCPVAGCEIALAASAFDAVIEKHSPEEKGETGRCDAHLGRPPG